MTDVSARPADPESRPRFRPWPAALSGIAWVVLFIAVRALAELDPLYEASPAEIGAYFAENTDKVFWSTQLLGLAALSLLWFAAACAPASGRPNPGTVTSAASPWPAPRSTPPRCSAWPVR
jgi:hypothetical protein